MNEDIKSKVIAKFNSEFGKDVKNLSKCEDFCKNLQKEKEKIENTLSLASSEVPTKVSAAVSDVETVCKNIEKCSKEYKSLVTSVNERRLKTSNDTINKLQSYVDEIEQLEQLLVYLRCIKAIQDLNQDLECALQEDDDERAIAEFTRLCSVCSRLHNSKCTHLVSFLRETVHYWHNILKTKFFNQFEDMLKVINWPIISSNSLFNAPSAESVPKLQLLIKHLLLIELPDELVSKSVVQPDATLLSFDPLPSPIMLLVRPLKKRFTFHFCSNKQTNRPDKPEWFLTQVLTWIRDHEQYITEWVQPVFNEVGIHVSATIELMRGLVELAVNKLNSELPSLQYDDILFSHAVDESLAFDRELKDGFGYPSNVSSAVTVLTQAQIFLKWLHMEQKYAREKMDALFNSETAWLQFSCIEGDELKVTEIGEAFLTLLSTITDRYKTLPQPGHRLQFLELQVELIDDFRVRLYQLLNTGPEDPLDSKTPAILNTASYVLTAFSEWGTDPHFLILQHHKSQLAIVGDHDLNSMQVAALQQGSVFDDALQLFNKLIKDWIDKLCDNVVMEAKARSRPYRRDRWFAMSSPHDEISPSVTPTACPMFQVLAVKLLQLEQSLAFSLFETIWKKIASQLNTFIMEELILQNTFNEGGAEQLQLDMTRNLFPLFRQYTRHPDVYFSQIKEACTLLTVRPLPSDILRNGAKLNNLSSLNIKLHSLTNQQAVDILRRRVELTIDVM